MIVKPVTDIKWFLERSEQIGSSFTYQCDWHPDQPQREFQTMPTFVGKFKNITAHSLPFLLTENDLMLTDHVWPLLWKHKHKPHKTHGLWSGWSDKIEIDKPVMARRFEEEDTYVWMPIDADSCNNAWHFWIDIWSRIKLIEEADSCTKNPRRYVYVFPNMGDYMKRALVELFPEHHYIVMPDNEYWHFKELIVPSMSNHQDGIISPGLPYWLYHMFGPFKEPTRKIFISREDAPARQLSNSDELLMALKGWERVNLSTMTIREQIETFSEASHIMSTHGAGLVNAVWANPGATVIEISQPELVDKKPYPILSMLKKHKHHVVFADKIRLDGDKPEGVKRLKDYNNLQVDISKILDLI